MEILGSQAGDGGAGGVTVVQDVSVAPAGSRTRHLPIGCGSIRKF